eukprot:m.142055 g.142055  ORF g.142055 m.142055 type:complete len:718 (-) comp17130_c0_seq1:58-2211(-)
MATLLLQQPLALLALLVMLLVMASASDPLNSHGPTPASRAAAVLAKMTREERFSMVHGTGSTSPYVGNVPAIPRLGVPALALEDGPQGIADGVTGGTCFPSVMAVASTWNATSSFAFGAALGEEQRRKGTNVMLGPGVCIARVPTGGRNFEYLSEDPVHAKVLGKAMVQGIQSQGVIACPKHFVANNQEGPGHNGRLVANAIVSERALRELYYPPFEGAAVEARAGSVMCSYNLINGAYACENNATLHALKDDLGYRGWVVTDWGSVTSPVASALAGLDQQMSGASAFGLPLQAAVAAGKVPQSRVDDMVLRMLTAMFDVGLFDRHDYGNLTNVVTSPAHRQLALALADESAVLLRNRKQLLPLAAKPGLRVAVLGDANTVHGAGSGAVIPADVVTPLEGIARRCVGCTVSNYSVWSVPCSSQCSQRQAPVVTDDDIAAMVTLAKTADVVILNVAVASGEGYDRLDMSLGAQQDKLVAAVLAVSPPSHTVVVVRASGGVSMPWLDAVEGALVFQLMPGEQAGNSLANLLFGDSSFSGKLPFTTPRNLSDSWVATTEQFPGVQNGKTIDITYSEDLYVGYRFYDKEVRDPLWPFGFGLSYTTFSYSKLSVSKSSNESLTAEFTIANSGARDGQEVYQVYVSFPPAAKEPPKLLKGFGKLALTPGQSKQASVSLSARELSVWLDASAGWQVMPGTYTILVGSSAVDIHLSQTVVLGNSS